MRAPGTSMGGPLLRLRHKTCNHTMSKLHLDRATPITMQQAHTTVTIAREKHIANLPSAEFLSAATAHAKPPQYKLSSLNLQSIACIQSVIHALRFLEAHFPSSPAHTQKTLTAIQLVSMIWCRYTTANTLWGA